MYVKALGVLYFLSRLKTGKKMRVGICIGPWREASPWPRGHPGL